VSQDIQALLGAFLDGGWDGIDANSLSPATKAKAEHAQALQDAERRSIAKLVDDVFATVEGRKLLALLIRISLRRRETEAELSPMPAEQYAVMKAHRAGQAAIVNWVLDMIEVARGDRKTTGVEG
jgi:hypothetical protein